VRQVAARLAARRGDVAVAQQHLDRALELVPIEFVGLDGRMVLLELLVGRGEPQPALGLFRAALTAQLAFGVGRDTDELLLLGARAAADVAERARDRRDVEGEQEAVRVLDDLLATADATRSPARSCRRRLTRSGLPTGP
jgi:hypothetical protein